MPSSYRVAMYIVISKPKRMSSKDGLDHFIATSGVIFDAPVRHVAILALRSPTII